MSYAIKYDEKMACIMVSVTGDVDMQLVRRMANEVAILVKEKGCKRILNNLSKAKLTKKAFDILYMPEVAKKAGISEGCKRALVVGEKVMEFYFFETVFINRMHRVKMFTNIEDARNWLYGSKNES